MNLSHVTSGSAQDRADQRKEEGYSKAKNKGAAKRAKAGKKAKKGKQGKKVPNDGDTSTPRKESSDSTYSNGATDADSERNPASGAVVKPVRDSTGNSANDGSVSSGGDSNAATSNNRRPAPSFANVVTQTKGISISQLMRLRQKAMSAAAVTRVLLHGLRPLRRAVSDVWITSLQVIPP